MPLLMHNVYLLLCLRINKLLKKMLLLNHKPLRASKYLLQTLLNRTHNSSTASLPPTNNSFINKWSPSANCKSIIMHSKHNSKMSTTNIRPSWTLLFPIANHNPNRPIFNHLQKTNKTNIRQGKGKKEISRKCC